MGNQVLSKPIGNFVGGETTKQAKSDMDPRYSLLCSNMFVSELGGMAKRPGGSKANTTVVTGVNMLSGYEFVAAGASHIITCGGTSFYELKGSPKELSAITFASGSWAAAKARYATMKGGATKGTVTFEGALNDLSIRQAMFTGRSAITFRVEIDKAGTPDTFKYSLDGGTTWDKATITVTADWQELAYGIQVKFLANTGHTLSDKWTFTVTPAGFICLAVGAGNTPKKIYENGANLNTATLGGSPPSGATAVHVYKNRAWMNDPTDPMIAVHSALADPEDWTTPGNAGYLDLSTVIKDQDTILGYATYVDLLVIFLKNHIAIYQGSDPAQYGDFSLVQVIKGLGCVNIDTLQNLGDDLAFLHHDGIKTLRQVITTGSLNTKDISEEMDPEITAMLRDGVTNFDSVHASDYGWYLVKTDAIVWCYHYARKTKPITRFVGMDCNAFFRANDGTVYMCGNGWLYKQFQNLVWSDAGNDITIKWAGAWHHLLKPGRKVNLKTMEIVMWYWGINEGAVTDIDMYTTTDYLPYGLGEKTTFTVEPGPCLMDEPVFDLWENFFLMDHAINQDLRLPLFGRGRVTQWAFENTSSKGPLEFNHFIPYFTAGGI